MISGLLTFHKWPEFSTRNPERSKHRIFQQFLLFLNSTYPTLFLLLSYSVLSLILLLLYLFFYLSLLYSSTFVSWNWIPWTEKGKASLGEGSLLESAWLQTGLSLGQGKLFPFPCPPTSHYRKLSGRPVYLCRCSKELVLIPEVVTWVLVPES